MTPASEAPLKRDPVLKDLHSLTGRVAIFGGTFDPVHCGHIEIGRRVIETTGASALLFIPAKINPLKNSGPIASDAQRLQMLSVALQPYPNWYLSSMELERAGASYTVDTLRLIRSEISADAKLIFVCGADQLPSLHKWRNIGEIFELADLVIVGRDGASADAIVSLTPDLSSDQQSILKSNFIPLSAPVSASQIRSMLASSERHSAAALLPPGVFKYVIDNNLYLESA